MPWHADVTFEAWICKRGREWNDLQPVRPKTGAFRCIKIRRRRALSTTKTIWNESQWLQWPFRRHLCDQSDQLIPSSLIVPFGGFGGGLAVHSITLISWQQVGSPWFLLFGETHGNWFQLPLIWHPKCRQPNSFLLSIPEILNHQKVEQLLLIRISNLNFISNHL